MIFGPYPAEVVKVVDGDSVRCLLDLGFGIKYLVSVRVYGINAPELNTEEGKEARAFAQAALPQGQLVKVTSHGWDKYGGRIDGDIYYFDILKREKNFALVMIESGHAVSYFVK